MRTLPLFLAVLLFAPIAHGADQVSLFKGSPCKEALEYHFLNRAAHGDDLIGAELLLKAGADVNGKGYEKYPDCIAGIEFSSPLMVAVWRRNIDMVRLLLVAGADPNLLEGEGVSPTDMAKQKGFGEILALLIQYGGK